MEPTKGIYIIEPRRLQRVKKTNIQYNDPNHTKKANSIQVRTRIQMGLRGLKINDGVQNPAQAKPEG
jgi:hypothetical protein